MYYYYKKGAFGMLIEYALGQPHSLRVFSIFLYNAVVLIRACSNLYFQYYLQFLDFGLLVKTFFIMCVKKHVFWSL